MVHSRKKKSESGITTKGVCVRRAAWRGLLHRSISTDVFRSERDGASVNGCSTLYLCRPSAFRLSPTQSHDGSHQKYSDAFNGGRSQVEELSEKRSLLFAQVINNDCYIRPPSSFGRLSVRYVHRREVFSLLVADILEKELCMYGMRCAGATGD